ncbi:type III-B CRISPR module RAMP protein Cmr4 [Aquifex aeolicus]|uniref:CRISPR type III-associated protein domain-containing protein n=1 Tax=Aquifex aeolicus (strain VF5) TaxID=224324 RepID=O66706_AQUAE|nr:type III-B CRISPR module RAMP protein Cmr4 [Aquifex aeolicus]AAC06666.1 putative protein [Aquifex aeolicus VF5]
MRRETYFIKAITPLHIGTGQGLTHIDLPIAREVHTGFPFIPGSAIKGCLREYHIKKVARNTELTASMIDEILQEGEIRGNLNDKEKKYLKMLIDIFGTAGEGSEESSASAGKVIFTDARLFLFPVRSTNGVFQLVTCPYVINRYLEDTGEKECFCLDLPDDTAVVYFDRYPNIDEVMLEEFTLRKQRNKKFEEIISRIPLESYQKERVLCVSDSVFSYMVKNYTEIQTHIKINRDSGTVESGALWTEEYLPAESVLYFNLFYEKQNLNLEVPEFFHLGGDITTGKGLVRRLGNAN